MWKEDGQDMSQIYEVIRTVNFLNRLIFKPDHYTLAAQHAGEQPDFTELERDNYSEGNKLTTPLELSVLEELSRAGQNQLTGQSGELLQILRTHSAMVFSRGDKAKFNY